MSRLFTFEGRTVRSVLATCAGALALTCLAPAASSQTARPTVDFTGTPTTGDAPLTVSFTSMTTGATQGTWTWGDGTAGGGRNPTHTYQNPGSYTVSLSVSGSGGTAIETKVDYIVVTGTSSFDVDFTATPVNGEAPLAVSFTGILGDATSATWDFGDGAMATSQNPTHTYTAEGKYTVTLTASGPSGTDTETKVDFICVDPGTGGGYMVDFTGTPLSGGAPLTVGFTAIAGDATSGTWDFGDGSTANSRNPSHTYNAAGDYTVSLTASGPSGTDTETKVDYVSVTGGGPVTPFPMTAANGDALLTNTFTNGNTHTGGNAWVDYNGDNWPDLLITNGGGLARFLYRNEGDGTFTDVSGLVAKADSASEDGGVIFGDVDNDGDDDILVYSDSSFLLTPNLVNPPEGGPNELFINNGDSTFTESALGSGLLDPRGWRNNAGAFADYDNDGNLDVYLATWSMNYPVAGNYDKYNRMLQGDGAGGFTDTTSTTDTDGYGKDTLVVLWWDADGDLLPELYVGNVACCGGVPPDYDCFDVYYHNDGGGLMSDTIGASPGIGDDACAAMGMDVADIDFDGDWDFYITDIFEHPPIPMGNPLYLGNSDGTLSENVADLRGVQADNSWPCNFADFDRDMDSDLWVGVADVAVQDYLYLNDGTGFFSDATPTSWLSGYPTRGGSIADYDGDGDVDVFMWNYADDSMLFRNDTTDTNNWQGFKLTGTLTNAMAIGAMVEVEAGGVTMRRRVSGGDSAHSQMERILHFGLGQEAFANVTVTWPSGTIQSFNNVPVTNEIVFIDESGGILRQALLSQVATYDPAKNEVLVKVKSSFGGRADLSVEGMGPLRYDASKVSFEGTFSLTGSQRVPASIKVVSGRGDAWDVPVE